MTAEKYYEYHVLLLPGIYQVNPIDLGFTLAFISRISIFKFHCHIFFVYYTILPNPQRQLQSDFFQTHPDDYNQIFAKPPTQMITIRFLPHPQTIAIKFLPHPHGQLQSDFCHTHKDNNSF
jgi:hypothetical protein